MSSAFAHGGDIVVTVDSSKDDKPIVLTADSQELQLLPGESITIRASTVPLLVATFGLTPYVDGLRKKLGFAT